MLTTMTQTWRHRSTGWNTISGVGPRVQLSLLFSSSGLPPLQHPQRSCRNQRAGLGFAFARPLHSYVLGASLAALNAPASSRVQALGQQEVIGILKPLIPHVSFCVQHKRECTGYSWSHTHKPLPVNRTCEVDKAAQYVLPPARWEGYSGKLVISNGARAVRLVAACVMVSLTPCVAGCV